MVCKVSPETQEPTCTIPKKKPTKYDITHFEKVFEHANIPAGTIALLSVHRAVSAALHTPNWGGKLSQGPKIQSRYHLASQRKLRSPKLKYEALEINGIVLVHYSYFEPLWKQGIYTLQPVAILRGPGWAMPPSDFCLAPCFFTISRSSSFGWHVHCRIKVAWGL